MPNAPHTLDDAIDAIEEAYEFMLAYAAQGRRRDDDDAGSGIRERLERALAAIDFVAGAKLDLPGAEAAAFLELVKADAGRARVAFAFVLSRPTIGSQIVDNLNASSHVRALLTDLFLLDEALGISGL